MGRSALDGVMLMDVAANYLREHVPENVRIHCVIRDGGDAPNVVPAYAKVWYYVRGKARAEVDEVRARLTDCARGAALATGTEMKWHRIAAVYHRLPNDTMCQTVRQNLELFGSPRVTRADRARVQALGYEGEFDTTIEEGSGSQARGSTDEDNVSWLAPLAAWPPDPATRSLFLELGYQILATRHIRLVRLPRGRCSKDSKDILKTFLKHH